MPLKLFFVVKKNSQIQIANAKNLINIHQLIGNNFVKVGRNLVVVQVEEDTLKNQNFKQTVKHL